MTTINAIEATQPEINQRSISLPWLTIERALYGAILLLAVGIRFFLLTDQPLNTLEASNAWTAWLVVNGGTEPVTITPTSPLLHTLYTLAFALFGGGDAVARVIPVVAGIGMVWLLWYWRAWLGRTTVLVAATLLALDPWFNLYSRLADSTVLSAFCGLLTLTALLQLTILQPTSPETVPNERDGDRDETDQPVTPLSRAVSSWQQAFAVGLGLLIVSGPQMWSWLVVLALFVVLVLPRQGWQGLVRRRSLWILAAGVAIVGATGWLAYPAGLGAVSTSLTVWLGQWIGSGATTYSLHWLWIRLITDLPLLLIFGILGLWRGWRNSTDTQQSVRIRFLSAWLLWGVLLALVPGRGPLVLAQLSLPLLLLAADAIGALIDDAGNGIQWRENGILLLVLGVLFLSFAFWVASFTNSTTFDNSLARTLVLILVLILLLIVAYALWIDGRQARLVTGGSVALVLLLWTISSSWALNHQFDLRHPDGFFATFTNPDVRQLADAVAMLSAQRHGDATELPIQVQMNGTPDPVLGWYLRDMRNLAWVLAPGSVAGQNPPVVITLSESGGVEGLSTAYLGSNYALRDQWLPTQLTAAEIAFEPAPDAGFFTNLQSRINTVWTARTRNLIRWMIYHKIASLPPSDEVTLWVATVPEAAQ